MKTIRDLLKTKGSEVWHVSPDTSVYEALSLMAEKNIGALLILDSDRLVGIFSERDYARKVILKGKASKETPVKEIMTSRVATVRSDQSIQDCMEVMTDKRIRHLPVQDDNQIRGVISIGDVVKAIISEQEFIIGQLENYISGR